MSDRANAPRVLLGNLEPMVRLGMSEALEQNGVEVLVDDEQPATLVAQAQRLRPDAVVLRLDDAETVELGERVRAVAPDTKLILWTRDEDEMHVFDPGSSTPRLIRNSVSEALHSELTPRRKPKEGE
jgi:DNA-binding NarL/FixJ family response regulator